MRQSVGGANCMRIAAVATAFPDNYYAQDELPLTLRRQGGDRLGNVEVLERLHRRLGVAGRHLALPVEAPDDEHVGRGQRRLDRGRHQPRRARGGHGAGARGPLAGRNRPIVFASVTGVASPSIDARLVNRLGLPASVRRLPLFGLGRVAGAAAVARAADVVRAYPTRWPSSSPRSCAR